MTATFYLLYVMAGSGMMTSAWGGPAIVRFETKAECEAAAEAMKGKQDVFHRECIPVTVR